jgi:Ca-activated chloride channel homolog
MQKKAMRHFSWSFLVLVMLLAQAAVGFSELKDVRLTKNLYIILDASGSMYQKKCAGGDMKINVAKQALITFLSSIDEETNVGLYTFDEKGPHEIVSLGPVDRVSLIGKIKEIKAGGFTPLAESIDAARNVLLGQKEKQFGYGEYTLLIVTDGESTSSRPLAGSVTQTTEKGIVVQVIGFCLEGAHSLKSLVHKYREANSPDELKSALEAVLGEAEEYRDNKEFESLSPSRHP